MEIQGLPLCPGCGAALRVTRLLCGRCGTEVLGEFRPALSGLSPAQQLFALRFLRARGNLKELERELGVAYQTLRGQLDEVVAALGGEILGGEDGPHAPSLLRRLRRGELGPEEALRILEEQAGGADEGRG